MMRYLFTRQGIQLLEELKNRRTLYAFDFDGTLCPIVSDPLNATLAPSSAELLSSLAQVVPVAVISGRSINDLHSRITCENIHLIGNHGAEGPTSKRDLSPSTQICKEWTRLLSENESFKEIEAGVLIENKGISMTVHYRSCANQSRAKGKILECVSNLHPVPRLVLGKCVVNLLPMGSPHKGDALREIMIQHNCDRALFVGDDVTDEDVFNMNDDRVLSVRVSQSETSAAPYFLKNQAEVAQLLKVIQSFYHQP
ncbi:MAG: trehalose-phosphatase [Bdellovibrionia bacterium]